MLSSTGATILGYFSYLDLTLATRSLVFLSTFVFTNKTFSAPSLGQGMVVMTPPVKCNIPPKVLTELSIPDGVPCRIFSLRKASLQISFLVVCSRWLKMFLSKHFSWWRTPVSPADRQTDKAAELPRPAPSGI